MSAWRRDYGNGADYCNRIPSIERSRKDISKYATIHQMPLDCEGWRWRMEGHPSVSSTFPFPCALNGPRSCPVASPPPPSLLLPTFRSRMQIKCIMSSDSPFEGHKSQPDAANSMGWPTITTIIILVVGLLLPYLVPRGDCHVQHRLPQNVTAFNRSPASWRKEELLHKSGYPSTRQLLASLPLTPICPFGRCRTATFVPTNAPRNLEYPTGTNTVEFAPLYATEDATIE